MSEEPAKNVAAKGAIQPAPGQSPDESDSGDEAAPPPIVERGMRRMMEMFEFQSGPAQHPILRGVSEHPELMDKFLDHTHAQEQHKTWLRFLMGSVIIGAVIGLSWLFLAYNQAEHIDAIIGAVLGLLGGFGAGVAYSKSQS